MIRWLQRVPLFPLKDFHQLAKTHLSSLNTFVCCTAFLAGGGPLTTLPLLITSTQCMAMSSQICNQLLEQRLDAQMARTARRPLVTGAISRRQAGCLGAGLAATGLAAAWAINPATAAVAGMIWSSYLFVYTPMKRMSEWNTLVGAFIGAGTVYMGWLASGSHPCLCEPLALYLYMVAWQLQHFWGIRWIYEQDYDRCFRMEKSRSQALLQSAVCMGLALLAGNYSLTYCQGNPFGLLNLAFSASIFHYGFRSMRRFEQDHDPRRLKKDSYVHFLVFMAIQALVIALQDGSSRQPRKVFRNEVDQLEQLAWGI
jgi:protoheme IX farnesyltransferase